MTRWTAPWGRFGTQGRLARTLALALVIGGSSAGATAPAALARPAGIAVGSDAADDDAGESEALPYLQCVPYARQVSGIRLYGDAFAWWDEAAGRYARGHEPKVGAVMSFRPYHAMQLGHVAMVSRIIDNRTVLLRHANWSPIEGRRGHVEDDVRAVDVSPANDWSEVRVWYAPIGDLGTTHWPINGFIYNRRPARDEAGPTILATAANGPRLTQLAANDTALTRTGGISRIDADFLTGIRPEPGAALPGTPRAPRATSPERRWQLARQALTARSGRGAATPLSADDAAPAALVPRTLRNDPIGRIIAARSGLPAR